MSDKKIDMDLVTALPRAFYKEPMKTEERTAESVKSGNEVSNRLAFIEGKLKNFLKREQDQEFYDFIDDAEFLLALVHQQSGELERCREAVGRYRGALEITSQCGNCGGCRDKARQALEDEE